MLGNNYAQERDINGVIEANAFQAAAMLSFWCRELNVALDRQELQRIPSKKYLKQGHECFSTRIGKYIEDSNRNR